MKIDKAREVSARIWCDQDYSHITMDVDLCEIIAQLLLREANKQEASQQSVEADAISRCICPNCGQPHPYKVEKSGNEECESMCDAFPKSTA
ncbi:MAG: hypothetical protein AMK71_04175 [Nitrospira bacterium SG8_35_4]|nr:MAG: hypothetical protein AMK71_04175 [Nitrospira bacterium SG8_35_4]